MAERTGREEKVEKKIDRAGLEERTEQRPRGAEWAAE